MALRMVDETTDTTVADLEDPSPGVGSVRMTEPIKMKVEHLDVYYGENHAIKDVSLDIPEREVTALMGPSGCGKSTFLRALNRMHDVTRGARPDHPRHPLAYARGSRPPGIIHPFARDPG